MNRSVEKEVSLFLFSLPPQLFQACTYRFDIFPEYISIFVTEQIRATTLQVCSLKNSIPKRIIFLLLRFTQFDIRASYRLFLHKELFALMLNSDNVLSMCFLERTVISFLFTKKNSLNNIMPL